VSASRSSSLAFESNEKVVTPAMPTAIGVTVTLPPLGEWFVRTDGPVGPPPQAVSNPINPNADESAVTSGVVVMLHLRMKADGAAGFELAGRPNKWGVQ
jgi:hypothetical protein